MKLAIAAGTLACAVATGDEIISTFGNDYAFTDNWPLVGQTFVVPESNVLDSIAVVIKNEIDEASIAVLYVFEWEDGQWVGDAIWQYFFFADSLDEKVYTFTDLGLHLERDQAHAIVLTLHEVNPFDPGVAYVDNAYQDGSLVTSDNGQEGLIVWPAFDMLFSLGFTSCPADFNGDGVLNIFDFLSFQGAFTAGDMRADCNGDGLLNVLDFVCFQARFLNGCP